MRATTGNLQPFDNIQKPRPQALPSLKQPLLRFQKREQQKKQQLAYGLKDSSAHWPTAEEEYSRLRRALMMIPVIDPESRVLVLWNLLVQGAVLFNLFMAPLVICFTYQAYQFDMQSSPGIALNAVSLTLLYIDLAVRFHIGFYRREKLITSRRQIFHNYIKFQFWVDLLSTICVTVYMAAGLYSLCYIRLGIYLRLPTLMDIDESILRNLSLGKGLLVSYRLLRMVVIVWLLTTLVGCVFFVIDYGYYLDKQGRYYQEGQLWLTNSQAVNYIDIITSFPQWYIWYEYALYWSIQTSATTGYGDLTGQNPPEIIFCNFIMILMTVLFAYFINYVWSIIKQVQDTNYSMENCHQVEIYLKGLRVQGRVKDRIGDFVREVFQDQGQREVQGFVLGNLSVELKEEFLCAARAGFYRDGPISVLGLGDYRGLMVKLVELLEQVRVPQEDFIYEKGQLDLSLYLVRSGLVKLVQPSSGLGQQVRQGEFFGAYEFFYQQARCHNAIADSFVRLWRLGRQEFKQCIKSYPTINKSFCMVSEQIALYKHQQIPTLRCWKCQTSAHFIPECPQSSYQISSFISNSNENQNQNYINPRRNFMRSQKKSAKLKYQFIGASKQFNCDVVHNYNTYWNGYNLFVGSDD